MSSIGVSQHDLSSSGFLIQLSSPLVVEVVVAWGLNYCSHEHEPSLPRVPPIEIDLRTSFLESFLYLNFSSPKSSLNSLFDKAKLYRYNVHTPVVGIMITEVCCREKAIPNCTL